MKHNMTIGTGTPACGEDVVLDYDVIIDREKKIWKGGAFLLTQTENAYKGYRCILNVDIIIYKDTAEGKRLKELVEMDFAECIKDFVDKTIIRNMGEGTLYELMKNREKEVTEMLEQKYEEGKKEVVQQIRTILGI